MRPSHPPSSTLSRAITRGIRHLPERSVGRYLDLDSRASCPLGAAFIGHYSNEDRKYFYAMVGNLSAASLCEFVHHGIMKAFPILGEDIRSLGWEDGPQATLSGMLVGWNVLRPIPAGQSTRKQAHHPSLFFVLTQLHDKRGWSKEQIAGLLLKSGL